MLLTFRQYAKHRNCSHTAVSKAVDAGRIPTVTENGQRFIDPSAADKAWLENTDSAKQVGGYTQVAGEAADLPADAGAGDDEESTQGASLATARAKRELTQAKIAELNYQKLAGELVSAEDVKTEAFAVARQVRESILGVPDRIAGQLAAEVDPHKIHALLSTELTKALQSLAG